jgi:uncharacterized protein YraI
MSVQPPAGVPSLPADPGVKYTFGTNNGIPVKAVNVRSGPAQSYPLLRVLEKAVSPFIYITTISGGYGQLADKSGWVYIAYFTKA